MMKGKKGGEKYLSMWWFVCLAIIAAGIIVGVLAMNVSDIDTKKLESSILISRVADCFVDNGKLQGVLAENFDIFRRCNLDKEIIGKKGGKFYLRYEVYREEDCGEEEGEFICNDPLVRKEIPGESGFPEQCEVKEDI